MPGYYVAHPSIPMERTDLMINFDMIGQNDPNAIFAVATRSSQELHRLHQSVNRHVGLNLIHPESLRMGRSDHTAFIYARVPVMYLFGGIDIHYNTPEDTADKLIPGKVERVARLAFLTAFTVAQKNIKLQFNESLLTKYP